MTLRGTDPKSYITEYTLVYEDKSVISYISRDLITPVIRLITFRADIISARAPVGGERDLRMPSQIGPSIRVVLMNNCLVPYQPGLWGSSGGACQGLWLRVQGSGFRVQGSGFRVQGSGFRVQGTRFRVQGSGFRVESSGFRVQG